jgi:hypothetical protein
MDSHAIHSHRIGCRLLPRTRIMRDDVTARSSHFTIANRAVTSPSIWCVGVRDSLLPYYGSIVPANFAYEGYNLVLRNFKTHYIYVNLYIDFKLSKR